MKTMPRAIALAAVTVLALAGCMRVEMNVDLQEDDTANGEIIMAFSQEMLALAGEGTIDELLAEENEIDGAVTEKYESEDKDANGDPAFVGTRTKFTGLAVTDFDAAGEDLRIFRDGDDYVVEGIAEDLTEQAGGQAMPADASATLSVTFPGPVSSHNGTLEGNTVTWDLLTHTDNIDARGAATASGGGFPVWLIITIVVLVGVGIGIAVVLVTSTRRKPTNEALVGNQGGAEDIGAFLTASSTADAVEGEVTAPAEPAIDAPAVPETEPVVDAVSTDGTVSTDDTAPIDSSAPVGGEEAGDAVSVDDGAAADDDVPTDNATPAEDTDGPESDRA